ncbi:hypothetical protein K457DRAFT_689874 [Linnemannia elongata AG-77]|uniref:Uncharacterized protein n=1 Tax=Linnemannia elongata AG-77 TaxID=1314771 RepID=A0A197JPV8_9FUNG|nr:hypothetical protein K457DRAFT_689874 [Linnemannia elongata AG-77]
MVSPASQMSRQQQPSQQSMVGSGLKTPTSTSLGGVGSVGRGYLDTLSTGPNTPTFGGANNSFSMTNMPNLRNAYGAEDEVTNFTKGGNLISSDDSPLDVYPPLNGAPQSNQVPAANRYQPARPSSNPVTPGRLPHDMRSGPSGHVFNSNSSNNNPTTLSQNQPLPSYDQRTATPAMSLKGDVMIGGGVTPNIVPLDPTVATTALPIPSYIDPPPAPASASSPAEYPSRTICYNP